MASCSNRDKSRNAQNPEPPRRRRNIIIQAVKWTLLAAVLFFVARALILRLSRVSLEQLSFSYVYVIPAAVGLLLVGIMNVFRYRIILSSFCKPPAWKGIMAVTWAPPLAKYVPGKFASVAGATWMLRKLHIPGAMALSTVMILQILSVMAALIVAAPLTLWGPVYQRVPLAWLWCVLLVTAGVVSLHPKIFRGVANFFLRRFRRNDLASAPGFTSYVIPVAITFLNRLLMGMVLWMLACSVAKISPSDIPFLISAFSLAGVAGYIAVFAPAGIGVREGVLLIILPYLMSDGVDAEANAAIIVVAYRALQIIVELFLAVIGLLMISRLKKGDGNY